MDSTLNSLDDVVSVLARPLVDRRTQAARHLRPLGRDESKSTMRDVRLQLETIRADLRQEFETLSLEADRDALVLGSVDVGIRLRAAIKKRRKAMRQNQEAVS